MHTEPRAPLFWKHRSLRRPGDRRRYHALAALKAVRCANSTVSLFAARLLLNHSFLLNRSMCHLGLFHFDY